MNILLILILTFVHDFHFSRVEMHHNVDEMRLEVSLHLYIDDLESALTSLTSNTLRLGTEKESLLADSLIEVYIANKFILNENDRIIELNWVGKEISKDLSAFYIHFFYPWQGKNLFCSNTLLIEQFDDQKNMIYFEYGDKKNYHLFDLQNHQKQLF